jgi:hypothetical protein
VLRPPSIPHALRAAVRTALLVAAAFFLALGPSPYGVPGAAAATAARPGDPTQPLVLRMGSITPGYVPERGPIVIRGTITNASQDRWTAINVHGFIGTTPITTTAGLAAAAQTPVTADVGGRIIAPRTFDHIDSLDPGQTASFTVRLPRSQLPVSAPGVYWFGVHALGISPQGYTGTAAGRDRTFLPLIPSSLQATGDIEDIALVAPVRRGVIRGSDGSIEDTEGWLRSLRSGSLHRAVTLGAAAQSHPLSWVLDPAVIDAVRQLAKGNPPRTLQAPGTGGGPSPGPSQSPSSSASATTTADSTTDVSPETVRAARQWLSQIRHVLTTGTGQTFGLPYGDLAVASALRHEPSLLAEGMRRTARSLRPWNVSLTPAVAPPSGRMRGAEVGLLPLSTDVLLDDTGYDGPTTGAVLVHGRSVVLAATAAAEGGPGPVDPTSNLALRQRILAEAAVRFLDQQQPLVVNLPDQLRHPRPSFFTGLDVPWVRLTSVDDATAGSASPVPADQLRAPEVGTPHLGRLVYHTARRTLRYGRVLQSVLAGNHLLRSELFTEVAGNASYSAAQDRFGALARMDSTSRWVADNLQGIDIAAPESVTLAGTSGKFAAIVSNTLDVPVTVEVHSVADSSVEISGGEGIQLPPHGQTTVLLRASTDVAGVHDVTLELTNKAGQALGPQDRFPLRAEQVSRLIWVIMGAGLLMLVAAIVVRLARRLHRGPG